MPFKLTAADHAKLRGVHPDLVRVLVRAASISPVPFRITEGLRSYERQKQLVAKGASKTLKSRHLTGHAVDLVPLVDMNGDGRFSADELYHWPLYFKLAPYIKQAAKDERVPIEWGGDWRTFKDGPHWQLPWKQYPVSLGNKVAGLMDTDPGYSDKTELADRAENAAMTASLGTVGVGATVTTDMIAALTHQQDELTSGDMIRVAIAGVILALTVFAIYRQLRT